MNELLEISTFGGLELRRGTQPLRPVGSHRVEALLVYLACDRRAHPREVLADMLWDNRPQQRAMANLRVVLFDLRRHFGSYVTITRDTVTLNPEANVWLDVTKLTENLVPLQDQGSLNSVELATQIEVAVFLYRGDFLEGFHLRGAESFEEWLTVERENLRRQVLEALSELIAYHLSRGSHNAGITHAQHLLQLDPLLEEAHQQLMRLLAYNGQRAAALAQYETCRRVLLAEFGVEPATETTTLFEQIQADTLEMPTSTTVLSPPLPAFLKGTDEPVVNDGPVFVTRRHELARLNENLKATLEGSGRTLFVTGGPGRGKTVLIQEFARRAQAKYPDLIVAGGNGNAYTGPGDPYLPFREILGLLTGEVEAPYAAGVISRRQARRLWYLMPRSIEAVLDDGRDLIETFLPGRALVRRATAYSHWSGRIDWLPHLEELVEQKRSDPAVPTLQQQALFEQYSRVLQALANQRPLLLVLDDLQWADPGSTNLLFHLGRHIEGNRILLVGAYRPAEVVWKNPLPIRGMAESPGEAERHPLEPVLNELKGHSGDIELDLGQADGRQFVDALLDTEANRLGDTFRETLYRQTGGHPLFTVELLRGMQERGDLVRDQQGCWIEGPALKWDTLPARVEAVIAKRIGQLPARLQQALTIASVEGETFTAELIAQVSAVDERHILDWLSGQLERRYRLVQAQGIRQVDEGRQHLSQYRFRHILFQKYLYSALDQVERAHLHQAVGTALEAFYGQEAEEITVQLARHFQEAGIAAKAVAYLHQPGKRAVRLSANEEAIAHLSRALALLETLPGTPERKQQEVILRVALGNVLGAAKGYGLPEVAQLYSRARELCQQLHESTELFPVLFGLWSFHYVRMELSVARKLGQQFLHLAQRQPDSALLVVAHHMVGCSMLSLGEIVAAREHLEQSIALYNRQQHRSLAFFYIHDPGMASLAYLALALWLLGYPDQALEKSRQALALDQEVSHPASRAFTLTWATMLHQLRREVTAVKKQVEALLSLSDERGFSTWAAGGRYIQGWALVEQGQRAEGIAQMTKGITALQAAGSAVSRSFHFVQLAEAYGKMGETDNGLAAINEALAIVNRTGERFYEAEIHRLRGKLLRKTEGEWKKAEQSPEDCFLQAIEVARDQQARSLELRTTMSLCRLWQEQGRHEEARQMLEEIYSWFTEGFDTADLKEAGALLEALTQKELEVSS